MIIKILLFICFSVLYSTLHATLKFESTLVESVIPYGSISTFTFKFQFKNIASHSIKIEKIESSCKCLNVHSDKDLYRGGDVGIITGQIEIEGAIGVLDKTIRIHLNTINNNVIPLHIKLTISESIKCFPLLLLWRKDEKIVKKTTTITFIDDSYSMDSNITKNDNYLLELEKVTSKKYYIHITPISTKSSQKYKIPLKIQTPEGIVYRDIFMLVR